MPDATARTAPHPRHHTRTDRRLRRRRAHHQLRRGDPQLGRTVRRERFGVGLGVGLGRPDRYRTGQPVGPGEPDATGPAEPVTEAAGSSAGRIRPGATASGPGQRATRQPRAAALQAVARPGRQRARAQPRDARAGLRAVPPVPRRGRPGPTHQSAGRQLALGRREHRHVRPAPQHPGGDPRRGQGPDDVDVQREAARRRAPAQHPEQRLHDDRDRRDPRRTCPTRTAGASPLWTLRRWAGRVRPAHRVMPHRGVSPSGPGSPAGSGRRRPGRTSGPLPSSSAPRRRRSP